MDKYNDPKTIVDVLNIFINTGRINNISVEYATLLLTKSHILLSSKFKYHLKTVILFASECLKRFV